MDDGRSPIIVIDVFEEGSGVPATLQRLGAQVVVEPLSAGDYRVSGGALVERKTVADLHGSLGRGRLWAQTSSGFSRPDRTRGPRSTASGRSGRMRSQRLSSNTERLVRKPRSQSKLSDCWRARGGSPGLTRTSRPEAHARVRRSGRCGAAESRD